MEAEAPDSILATGLKVAAGAVAGVVTLVIGLWKIRSKDKKALADEVTEHLTILLQENKQAIDRAERKADQADKRADRAERRADESERKHEECKVDRERLWAEVALLRQRTGLGPPQHREGAD